MSYNLTSFLQISNNADPPVIGEALKIRFPSPLSLETPESLISQIPATISESIDQANYHTAFVKSSAMDMEKEVVHLELWVSPAISMPDAAGETSVDQFLSWPESKRNFWIPLPYQPLPGAVKQWRQTDTPPLFGARLRVGGWTNTRPSWLGITPVKMELRFTKSFKRFDPPVKLSVREMIQIYTYEKALKDKATGSTITQLDYSGSGNIGGQAGVVAKSTSNLVGKAPAGGQWDTRHHTEVFGDDYDDSDGEGNWGEKGDFGELLGILARHDSTGRYMEMFEDHCREVRSYQREGVQSWLNAVD